MAEGMKLVIDALDVGWSMHVMIYAKRMAHEPHLQAAAARARARGALILEVSEKVLGTIIAPRQSANGDRRVRPALGRTFRNPCQG